MPSTARESADRISSETTSAIQNTIQSEADKLKSHIAQYYSVGLWSYCKYGHVSETTCSDPSLNFAFNLSSALGSALVKIDEVLRPIDEATISGYRQMSHAIIYLYISGLVAITLAAALGIQKTLFDRGNRLLSILSPVCENKGGFDEYGWLTMPALGAFNHSCYGWGNSDVRTRRC